MNSILFINELKMNYLDKLILVKIKIKRVAITYKLILFIYWANHWILKMS